MMSGGSRRSRDEFEIDVASGHDYAGVFEADDFIRDNLFRCHIFRITKEGYAMFWWECLTKVVCEQCPEW